MTRAPQDRDLVAFIKASEAEDAFVESQALSRLEQKMFGVEPAQVMLSRYVVHRKLATGGLGIVYEAYDPGLQRRVAIKLLRSGSAQCADALLAEARVMAQLSHPNVVGVYDVGFFDPTDHSAASATTPGRGVFIAMEFVDGQTLRRWLEGSPPPAKILDALSQAAAGLNAAHRRGLVHLDFKPDNIIVGLDGRVRVLDFGLARALPDLGGTSVRAQSDRPHDHAHWATTLSRAGSIVGTPAYMAPEQHRGETPDQRADVFAFCVTAVEALTGVLPFRGSTMDALAKAKQQAPNVDVPRLASSTAKLLLQGLSAAPADRPASIEGLADALRRQRQRPRHVAFFVAGLAFAGLSAALAWPSDASCDGSARIQEVWGTPAKERVQEAFASAGDPAGRAFKAVNRDLDRYAGRWVAAWDTACEAGRVGAPATLHELQLACLDRRRLQLHALVEHLAAPGFNRLESTMTIADTLDSTASCSDTEYLTHRGRRVRPADAQAAARIDDLLAHATIAGELGDFAKAEVLVAEASARVAAIEYPSGHARALSAGAGLAAVRGDVDRAQDMFHAALSMAERADDAETRVSVWTKLAHEAAVGRDVKAHQRAVERARAILSGLAPRPKAELALATVAGLGAMWSGDHERAVEELQRSLDLHEVEYGADHFTYGHALSNLAAATHSAGDHARALPMFREALAIVERAAGDQHPTLGHILNGLAIAERSRGELAAAVGLYERATAVVESAWGPDHPNLAVPLSNLGNVLVESGDVDAADAAYARALELFAGRDGEDARASLDALRGRAEIAEQRRDGALLAELRSRISAVEALMH